MLYRLGRLEQSQYLLVGKSVPILWEPGKPAALIRAFEAEPALAVFPEVVFSGRLGVDGRGRDCPHLPLGSILGHDVPNCHYNPPQKFNN